MSQIKKVLVTGGAGFIGSWLVDELIMRGYDVTSIDDLSGGFLRNVNPKSRFVKMDLRDDVELHKVVEGQDAIFHLAAYAAEGQSVFSPKEINDINIRPMNNLLVSAVNHGIKKFVFTSSMAVYGNQHAPFDEEDPIEPEDPYGCGKAYCERTLQIFSRTYGFAHTIIRPHNVFGPRQNISDPYRNVLGIWMNMILQGKSPFIYGDGFQIRAFSYVGDIVAPLANAIEPGCADGEIINLGSEEKMTIKKACSDILDVMKSNLKPTYMEKRPCEVKFAYCTTKKSEDMLGYKTKHSFKEGIEKMYNWVKEIGHQEPSYRIPLEITKHAPLVWRDKLI